MKYDDIEISRQLETVVPVETETQRILRGALERLGPNGENWWQGARCNVEGTKFCAYGAISVFVHGAPHGIPTAAWPARKALWVAAVSPATVNDDAKDFSEVRAMFLKAIELSA